MDIETTKTIFLGVCFFTIATLYSSVGHGGASGYLLILSFLSFTPLQMASTSLALNLLVAGTAFYAFYKNGYFSLKFSTPFIITSIPAAFIGGMLNVPRPVYSLLLGVILLFVAFRLIFEMQFMVPVTNPVFNKDAKRNNLWIALPAGLVIGLLSGIIGIGGGILLSPLILLLGWANTKQTAATSAFFILVNSLAGVSARFVHSDMAMAIPAELIPYISVAFIGGLIGSHMGARIFSALTLKRILAVILIMASSKLIIVTIL